jgi:hypothetical protein
MANRGKFPGAIRVGTGDERPRWRFSREAVEQYSEGRRRAGDVPAG